MKGTKQVSTAETLKVMLAERSPHSLSLEEGVAICNELWPAMTDKVRLTSSDFNLARYPHGWSFTVVNNWYEWVANHLEYEFGTYERPEDAVAAFLEYVLANNVDVRALADEE